MRHALEADHVAAVASLSARTNSIKHAVRQGAAWGLGHTLTLFLFGAIVLFVTDILPANIVNGIELAVGVMLIVLGADVLWRLVRDRIHFHSHTHGEGTRHFHAHSHRGDNSEAHGQSNHHHQHSQGFPLRALLVGLMHGMAGSAALILLTLQSISSPWLGLIYIAIFGVGSIAGMALFSLVITIPLRAARHMTWLYNTLHIMIGIFTIGLGTFTIVHMI